MPETGSFLGRARGVTAALLPAGGYSLLRAVWRRARLLLPHGLVARTIPGVPGRVHVEDGMLRDYSPGAIAHYIATGREPLRHMDAALAATGRRWDVVRDFLDYGGGYGRVLRWVVDAHPHVRTTVADINVQAARFAARELGARPLLVDPRRGIPTLPPTFDLIWVGSVFTHLDEAAGRELLASLAGALRPAGLLLFTTHGAVIPERLPGLGADVLDRGDEIAAALAGGEIVFLPEVPGKRYPLSFHAPAAVRTLIASVSPPLRLLAHAPRGWDDNQDVWTCAAPA